MSRHAREDDEPVFRILYVCTGNICRSPVAEVLTRHMLVVERSAATFAVSSAGVAAVAGAPMHRYSREHLAGWGVGPGHADRFRARQLHPSMIEEADLVLGASVRHRSAVVQQVPRALASTFSLREFARLAAAVDVTTLPTPSVARARALVRQARACRGVMLPPAPGADDIVDPVRGSRSAHHEAAARIVEAVRLVVDVIVPRPDPRS